MVLVRRLLFSSKGLNTLRLFPLREKIIVTGVCNDLTKKVCPSHGTVYVIAKFYNSTSSDSLPYALHIPDGAIDPNGSWQRRLVKENVENIEEVIEEYRDKIHRLSSHLNCSFDEMRELVRKDTRLVTSFKEIRVMETITLLKQYGYSDSEILANPPAFCLNLNSLQSRLREMKAVRCKRLYVLKYGRKHFLKILDFYEKEKRVMKSFSSRETFLAAMFGREEPEILEKAEVYHHLLTFPVSRLDAAFKMLCQWGFTKETIWGELNLLILPPLEMKFRLDKINAVGIDQKEKIVALLRFIPRSQFDSTIALWEENQRALDGHPDITSYLAARLHCTAEVVEKMFKRCKTLQTSQPKRVKLFLDVLLNEMCIPSNYIIDRPNIFSFSVERLRLRYNVLLNSPQGDLDPRSLIQDILLPTSKFNKKYNLSD